MVNDTTLLFNKTKWILKQMLKQYASLVSLWSLCALSFCKSLQHSGFCFPLYHFYKISQASSWKLEQSFCLYRYQTTKIKLDSLIRYWATCGKPKSKMGLFLPSCHCRTDKMFPHNPLQRQLKNVDHQAQNSCSIVMSGSWRNF